MRITVAASQSMRVFEVPVYEVEVRENVAPPTLLIDLNATFEMAERPVEYHIISSYPDGTSQCVFIYFINLMVICMYIDHK